MDAKPRNVLAGWLLSGATLAEVETINPEGIVGNRRFDPRIKEWFRLFHAWRGPRFGGSAGLAQDRTYRWGGRPVLDRRHRRHRRLLPATTCPAPGSIPIAKGFPGG